MLREAQILIKIRVICAAHPCIPWPASKTLINLLFFAHIRFNFIRIITDAFSLQTPSEPGPVPSGVWVLICTIMTVNPPPAYWINAQEIEA